MENILVFFRWFGIVLLFLVLQGISFFYIVQHNRNQQIIFLNTSRIWAGALNAKAQKINNLFSAQNEADSLAAINMVLMGKLPTNFYISTFYRDTGSTYIDTSEFLPDTVPSKDIRQLFSYIGARVVSNSIVRPDNYITIDRGSDAGIQPGMGVVSGKGVVGIVKKVTRHYSLVMSLLHQKTFISASVRRNRYFGSMRWTGMDSRYMDLENIPKYADVVKGDTIQTSGYSEIFPAELPIGIVDSKLPDNGSNFQVIRVKLFNEFARLGNVYVIKNDFSSEIQQLQSD